MTRKRARETSPTRTRSETAPSPSKTRLSPDPVDPHDSTSFAAIYRYPLLHGDLTNAVPRENVLDFFYPHQLLAGGAKKPTLDLDRLKQRRDLFLLAFEAVQQLPSSDKWSFYQIAGIHGLPHAPYDGDKGNVWTASSDWWGGYCQHGNPLFPTWHRPYMLLFEQSIIRQAKLLAETFTDAEEKKIADEIADQLRIPFWDWADHSTRILGLPDVFTSTQISLSYNWKSFSRTTMPNPLKAFVLPVDVSKPISSSDVFNPAAKPNYVVPSEGTPFTPLGYPTVRHVSAAYTSQNDQLNVTLMRNSGTTLVEGVHSIFHHDDWLSFSNHFWSEETHGDGSEFGHYSSLELVHDFLHGTVGGAGGHMTYPELAAFDPIFFFHHANIDRLIALWQFCYPKSWIPRKSVQLDSEGSYTYKPDSPATPSTDLTPFRRSKTADNEFVSSDDVRTVDVDCGYTYPEIFLARKESWKPSDMLRYVLTLYRPPQYFVHKWILVMENILKRAFNGPFSIRVFLDKPDATADTPVTIPNFAGAISVFARSNNTRCANCDKHRFMRGSLDLTKTMVRLGIATAVELSGDTTDATPGSNPLAEEGSIKVVFVDPTGKQLNPGNVSEWAGPKLTLYFQEGVRDEQINEALVDNEDVGNVQLPKKPVHKFQVTSR